MKSFIRSFVRRSFVRRFVRSFIRSLIDKLYTVLYKQLLMGVPEIVFQPVKITSADSAGQRYIKLYKEPFKEDLNEEL